MDTINSHVQCEQWVEVILGDTVLILLPSQWVGTHSSVTSRSSATDHCHDLRGSCMWPSAHMKRRENKGEVGPLPNNHVSWLVLVVEVKHNVILPLLWTERVV